MWPENQPLETNSLDSVHLIYWIKCLGFWADLKNGNESGDRGCLWDQKLVFVLFSQRNKARRFVFKSLWWHEPPSKDGAKTCEWKAQKLRGFLPYGRGSAQATPLGRASLGHLRREFKLMCFVHLRAFKVGLESSSWPRTWLWSFMEPATSDWSGPGLQQVRGGWDLGQGRKDRGERREGNEGEKEAGSSEKI